MSVTLRFIPLILGLAASAAAQTTETPFSVTVTPSYVSEYMFRGRQLAGASFQPAVQADWGRAIFGLWSSVPFSDTSPKHFDELDPYASYSIPLSGKVSLTPGIVAYTYPVKAAAVSNYHTRVEPNLSLSYIVHGVSLSPTVYYDVALRSLTSELNAAVAVPLAAIGTELDLNGTLGHYHSNRAPKPVTAPASLIESAWGGYWLLGATLPYQLAKGVKASIGYAYTAGINGKLQLGNFPAMNNPLSVGRNVLTASVAITF